MKKLVFGFALATGILLSAQNVNAQAADFCTNVKSATKMAATNFKEVKGELNEEETELEGEDVFNATLTLEGFENALILPTFTEGKSKIQFYTLIAAENEADDLLKSVKTKLDGCLNTAAGFKARVDSDIYFHESTTVTLQLMRSTDSDDNGDAVFKVLVQCNKR